MTNSPSDVANPEDPPAEETETVGSAAEEFGASIAAIVGSDDWAADRDTVRVRVDRDDWVDAVRKARDEGGLPFFSWLSAVDWAREVTVGEPAEDADQLTERYDVMCRLSSVNSAESVHLVAAVPKDDPVIDSVVPLFGGAAWHEREAAEMFGLRFTGHPHLVNIYLPEEFEGHPLRKSFPLLAREVKPWPGTVDVEDMPSTENKEAAATAAGGEGDGGDA